MLDIYDFLDLEEEKTYASFARQISALLARQLAYYRGVAAKKGIISRKLSDLRSGKSETFDVDKDPNTPRGSIVMAFASDEAAYFCKKGCGWVRGRPIEHAYYDGAIVPSKKTICCRICQQEISAIDFRK